MSADVPESPSSRRLVFAATVVLTVSVLYFAREVLIPLTLAGFFAFLLSPLVTLLERVHLGRTLSALMAAVLGLAVCGLVSWYVTAQAADVLAELPRYQNRIIDKIRALRSSVPESVSQASRAVMQISKEISRPASAPADVPLIGAGGNRGRSDLGPWARVFDSAKYDEPTTPRGTRGSGDETSPSESTTGDPSVQNAADRVAQPVRVEVVPSQNAALDRIVGFVGPVVHPLVTFLLTAVFMVFFLLYRVDLRNRMIRLAGHSNIQATATALAEVGQSIQHYLLRLAIANAINGTAIGLGLLVLGVPNAIGWGIVTAILRFIPVLGAWLSAALPFVLSIAVFDGWFVPIMVVLWIVLVDQASVTLLEPFLYSGRVLAASPLALLLAFVFWTWLWGGIGLFLATPIVVCLVILGRHFAAFETFAVVFGNEHGLAR